MTEAVTGAWYGNANVWHNRFEKAFAEYLGLPFVTSLPSCTSAIHLSLAALGIGPGDEVIVPECTWIATSAPIRYVGATPVFADIDRDSWCLSAKSFEACITPRTKAVIPVDLYGSVPDYDEINRIAAKHGVSVIEDAAEAIGAEYRGRRAGSLGRTGVFSFHGSKTLTTGEGGLLATADEALFRRILHLRDHGREPGDRFFRNTDVGFKYKMSSMQAALGLAQLERVEELITRKRQIFGWYQKHFRNVPGVTLNKEPEGTRNAYWMVTVVWDPVFRVSKEDMQLALEAEGIDVRPFFYPLSVLPAYKETPTAAGCRDRNLVAYDISSRALNLPSAMNLTEEQVERAAAVFLNLLVAGVPSR